MASLEASLELRDKFTSVLAKINSGLQKASQGMETFKEKVAGPAAAFQALGNRASAEMQKLNSIIRAKMASVSNIVQTSTERIVSLFGNFGNRISSKLGLSGISDKFKSVFSSVKSTVAGAMEAVKTKVSSAFTKIKAIVKGAGPVFKQFGTEIKASFDKVNASVSTVGNKIGNTMKVLAVGGVAAGIGLGKKIYDIAGGFDQQMARVNAITDEVGVSFAKLRTQAVDLGAQTAFSATEAAAGMENMASAGFNTQEIYDSMNGVLALAAVSGGDVALAAENSASALRGFGLEAGQAGHVADVFARAAADTNAEVADMGEAMKYISPVAHAMGISLEETAAAVGILSDSGIKGSQAGTSLRGALSRLAKPTKAMSDKMAELGLKFYDSKGNMKSLAGQVSMLKGAFKGLTPEQQQNALVTLYGQESLSGMLALISAGPDKLSELTKSFKDSGGAANEMAEQMQNNLPSKIEQMFGALESVAIRIGDKLFPVIGPQIEKLTDWIDKTLSETNIGSFIDKLSKYGAVLKGVFDQVKGPISEAAGAIGKSLDKINGKFGSSKNVNKFKGAFQPVVDMIKGLAEFAEKHSDGIAKLISNLPKLMIAFAGFKISSGILGTLTTFGSGILGMAKASGKLVSNLAKLGKTKPKVPELPNPKTPGSVPTPGTGTNPFSPLLDTANSFAKSAGKLALVFGVIKIIEEAAQALKDVNDKVPKDLASLAPKMINMAIALTAMGGFVKLATRVVGKDLKGAATGLGVVAGISANIILAAVALQQIQERVSDDIGTVAKKMASMAIALGTMGALVAVAGLLSKNPVAAISGLAVVAGISANLILAAFALQQVQDRVSDDIGSVAKKVASMAIAIGGMGLIVLAVGALMATGIGAIAVLAGLATVALIAGDMILVAVALQQFNDKVPEDISGIKSKIDIMAQAIQAFTDADLGSVVDLFSNIVGSLNIGVVTSGIQKMQTLGDELQKFNPQIPTDIKEKITLIEDAISALSATSIGELVGHMVSNWDYSVVTSMVNKLIKIGNSFIEFSAISFSPTMVVNNIDAINTVINALGGDKGFFSKVGDFFSKGLDNSLLDSAQTSLSTLIKLGNKITELGAQTINATIAIANIKAINTVMQELGSGSILDWLGSMIKSSQLSEASTSVGVLVGLVPKINELAATPVNSVQAVTVIQGIKNVLNELVTLNGTSINVAVSGFDNLASSMDAVVTSGQGVVTVLGQLQTSQSTLVATTQTTGSQILASMTDTATRAQSLVTSAMEAIKNLYTTGMTNSVSAVTNGNAKIVSAFSGLNSQLHSAGSYAMQGLTAGIISGSGDAIAQARNVANQVSATIKNALQIHSPSRVMMEVGQFVGKGLANGIAATRRLVASASNSLAMSSVPEPLGDLSANGVITNSVQLDDSEISRLKASASQQVIVKNKQVTPQVTINIDNSNGQPIDTDALLQEFENRIEEMMDADLS